MAITTTVDAADSQSKPAASSVTSKRAETKSDSLAKGILVYVVDPKAHAAFCEQLHLSEAQRKYADYVFELTGLEIERVITRVEKSLAPSFEQLRTLPRESFAVGAQNSPEVHKLLVDASRAVRRTFSEAKVGQIAAFEQYRAQLAATLDEEQAKLVDGAIRHWHRSMMLNPTDRNTGRDLDRHADLVKDIEALGEEDEAFLAWNQTSDEFQQAILAYELDLDSQLTTAFWYSWDESLRARTVAIENGVQAVGKERRRAIERWMRIYHLNEQTVAILQAIVGAPDHAAWGERLVARFRDSYFPWLYSDKSADVAYQWLAKSEVVTDQQKEALDVIYGELVRLRAPERTAMERGMIAFARKESLMPGVVGLKRLASECSKQLNEIIERRRGLNLTCLDRMLQTIAVELHDELKLHIRLTNAAAAEMMEF